MYHFWYFPAIILGFYITWRLLKWGLTTAYLVAIFLYFIGLLGDSYYGMISNTFLSYVYDFIFVFSSYTRNGIF